MPAPYQRIGVRPADRRAAVKTPPAVAAKPVIRGVEMPACGTQNNRLQRNLAFVVAFVGSKYK